MPDNTNYWPTFLDALAGFGRGLGVSGLSPFTIPGDLRQGMRSATDPLFDSIDSATGYQCPANAPTRPYYDIMPSTQDVRDYLRQPQTDAGKKAQTLGEILPFALGAPVAMRHMAGKAMGPIADTLGSYMPPEALWSLLAGAAPIPAGWAAARPQYTKPTTDIFSKSHFGGTSPAY